MKFIFHMPTEVYFGENCVRDNAAKLATFGKKALIVTGKSSAKNGSLDDVTSALQEQRVAYSVFDGCLPNPDTACVRKGMEAAENCRADFIVAVGGGSPMDCAKAIAAFAGKAIGDAEMLSGAPIVGGVLPVVTVPTTAGTGSEVTQYSILTNNAAQTKTSISSPMLFPKAAFVDARYMSALNTVITLNTALDALSHAVEGCLSVKGSGAVPLAYAAMREIMPLLGDIKAGGLSLDTREKLAYAATLGGMVIAQTGTVIAHGMGYQLTYHDHIDHGRANALVLGALLKLAEKRIPSIVSGICAACGTADASAFAAALDSVLGEREKVDRGALKEYAKRAAATGNFKLCNFAITEADVLAMYESSLPQ